MKTYSSLCCLKYTWDYVAAAFWQRYPNPDSKHVLSEDVLSREVVDGKLYSRRILFKTNNLPSWGLFLIGSTRQICIIEESVVDPILKTVTTYTRNLCLRRVLAVEEKCVLRPSNDRQTICERYAWVNSPVLGLGKAIQKFGLDRYKKNAAKAMHGFNYVLDNQLDTQKLPTSNHTKDKLRDKARQAKDIAKAKGLSMLHTN